MSVEATRPWITVLLYFQFILAISCVKMGLHKILTRTNLHYTFFGIRIHSFRFVAGFPGKKNLEWPISLTFHPPQLQGNYRSTNATSTSLSLQLVLSIVTAVNISPYILHAAIILSVEVHTAS